MSSLHVREQLGKVLKTKDRMRGGREKRGRKGEKGNEKGVGLASLKRHEHERRGRASAISIKVGKVGSEKTPPLQTYRGGKHRT